MESIGINKKQELVVEVLLLVFLVQGFIAVIDVRAPFPTLGFPKGIADFIAGENQQARFMDAFAF